MRYLGARGVAACLAEIDPVEAVRSGLLAHQRGETLLPAEYGLRWTTPGGEQARSLGLPAALLDGGVSVGVKIINANPANTRRGLPRASGLVALFDPDTAEIRSLLDAGAISATRTAAVTALAVTSVGRSSIDRMAIMGAGILGEAHIDLLVPRLPGLAVLEIVDLNVRRAEALAARAERHGITVEAGSDARAAAARAHLVVTTTTTTTPYLFLADVAPGTTVVNVSLDDLGTDLLLGADLLVVDDWNLVSSDTHRRLGRLAAEGRVVGPDQPDAGLPRVHAELPALIAGTRPGRTGDEVVVVNPFGMGIADIALARVVEARAEASGRFLSIEDRAAPSGHGLRDDGAGSMPT